MKISTKGRYALAIMLDLAMNNPEEYISLKDVCKINMGQSPDSSSYNDNEE